MRYTRDQLTEMLDDALDLPPGESQIAGIEDVIRHLDGMEAPDLLVEARLALIDAYIASDPVDIAGVNETIALFTRTLALLDAHPEQFGDDQLDDLWRQFATFGLVMVAMPDYPLRQIRGVIDDMRRRVSPDRNDRHTLHTLDAMIAGQVDDRAGLDGNIRALRTLDPAEYVCPASMAGGLVNALLVQGRDEDAIEFAGPILGGEIPCVTDSEPRSTLAALALPYLRTGRVDSAVLAHRMAYRGFDSDAGELAAHLAFCALTGNETRGFQIFTDHLDLLGAPPDGLAETERSAAAALLLRRLVEQGRGDETVAWPVDPEDEEADEEDDTIAGLYEEFRDEALTNARRFDERNGDTFTSARIAALIDAAPLVDHLPLSDVDAPRARAATVAPVEEPLPDDPAALLGELETALLALDHGRANAAQRRLDEVLGAHGPADPLIEAHVAELNGRLNRPGLDAEAELRRAASAYDALGHSARAEVSRSRLGRWLHAEERTDEALPVLTAAAGRLAPAGEPIWYAEAEIRLASALGTAGDQAGALAALDRAAAAVPDVTGPTDPGPAAGPADPAARAGVAAPPAPERIALVTGRIEEERALALARSGPDRTADALAAAGRARDAYRAANAPLVLANMCLSHATLALGADDAGTAVEAYREAAANAGGDPHLAATTHVLLGRQLRRDGRAAEAVPELVEAVAAHAALGDPRTAMVRVELATAYLDVDRPLDAAECAEEALPAFAEEPGSDAEMQARWVLALAYPRLGQHHDAIGQIDIMLRHEKEPAAMGRLHGEAGRIHTMIDEHAEAAVWFAAAAGGYAVAGNLFDRAEAQRFAALAHSFAGEIEESLAALSLAQEAADALPDGHDRTPWERAMLSYDAARILAGAGRPDEAAVRARAAVDGFRSVPDEEHAKLAEELLG